MNAVFSIIILIAVIGLIIFLLSRRENTRRSQYGPAGLSEFRTDLPLDDCFDRLDQHSEDDVFAYECRRENDGGFLLPSPSTAHKAATGYPVHSPAGSRAADRGDAHFYPGSLWLSRAAFPARHAGRVPAAEAGSAPHQIKNGKTLFIFAFFCYTIRCGSARALPQP